MHLDSIYVYIHQVEDLHNFNVQSFEADEAALRANAVSCEQMSKNLLRDSSSMFAIDVVIVNSSTVVGSGGTVVMKTPARPCVDYAFEDEASFYEHRAGLLAIQKKNCEVSNPIVCFWKRSTSQF
jgi:hypothetical protein